MQYNYGFEIMSLVFLAAISGHLLLGRQFPAVKTKVSGRLLAVCLGGCAANILLCIGLANAAIVPVIWNELFAFVFFALEGTAFYLMFRYMEEVCCFSDAVRRWTKYMGKIPFFLYGILLLATPWTGFFFSFKNGLYEQGTLAWFRYAYTAYYFFMNLLLIFSGRAHTEQRSKVMRNPSVYVDSRTGTSEEQAFFRQMKNVMGQSGKKVFFVLHIRQLHQMKMFFGYENSRRVLVETRRYLTALCGKSCVFHNAEDTFTILLDEEEETRIKEHMKKRFGQDFQISGNTISLDAVVVVLHYPQDFQSLAEYRALSGYLSEEAQNFGKRMFFQMDEETKRRYYRRKKVEQAVNAAIAERQFEVYYQPIYSLKEKRIVSLEALVRLHDDELGMIPPDEFIPLAERNGTITQISEIVLEACCRFLAKHVLSNASLGIRTIHVNIAAAQCLNRSLKESILSVLEQYHVPADLITLELPERTASCVPEMLRWNMQELNRSGMGIAVGDYGSGKLKCSDLIRFPFQEIKMDKNMTWSYFENPAEKIVVENEIKTIQKLGLPLIAEGVESKEQSDALEALGIDMIQGYYYGRPMPEMECLRYIRSLHPAREEYGKDC